MLEVLGLVLFICFSCLSVYDFYFLIQLQSLTKGHGGKYDFSEMLSDLEEYKSKKKDKTDKKKKHRR